MKLVKIRYYYVIAVLIEFKELDVTWISEMFIQCDGL